MINVTGQPALKFAACAFDDTSIEAQAVSG